MAIQLVLQGKKIDISESSITALIETSPATKSHKVGDYIYYNSIVYIVKLNIAIGDNLIVDTNIEVPTLSEGTVVYIPQPGGGSVINGSNPNLLINPWFTVNQRGFTSGSKYILWTYTIDMWKALTQSNGSISVTANVVKLTPPSGDNALIEQVVENITDLNGSTLTASLMLNNGTILQGTVTSFDSTSTTVFVDESDIKIYYNAATTGLRVAVTSEKYIKAVKLELGSVSTLANDSAPDYTTELLKCQRYFYRVKAETSYCVLGIIFIDSATVAIHFVRNSVPMRTKPTASYSGSWNIAKNSNTNYAVSDISVRNNSDGNNIVLTLTSSGMTPGEGTLYNSSNSAYIDLSAEL